MHSLLFKILSAGLDPFLNDLRSKIPSDKRSKIQDPRSVSKKGSKIQDPTPKDLRSKIQDHF